MTAGGGGKRPRHGQFNKNFSWRKTSEKFFAYGCSFDICVIQIFEYILWVLMQKNIRMENNQYLNLQNLWKVNLTFLNNDVMI